MTTEIIEPHSKATRVRVATALQDTTGERLYHARRTNDSEWVFKYPSQLFVRRDAAAMVANILKDKTRFRLGVTP